MAKPKATETVKLTEEVNGMTFSIVKVGDLEILRIEAPLSGDPPSSKSGRSKILAGTSGFVYLKDATGVSLSVVEGNKHPRTD